MNDDLIIPGGEGSIIDEPIPSTEPLVATSVPDATEPPIATDATEPQPPITTDVTKPTLIGNLFGTMQESVTIAWRFHLKADSYSAHIALNDFYGRALYIVDSAIEHYMPIGGDIEDYYNDVLPGNCPVEYLNELRIYVIENRPKFINETIMPDVWSDIDDFIGLIDSTMYKLTHLDSNCVKSFESFCYEDYEVIGVEGGVGGDFDNVTKSTPDKTNKDKKDDNDVPVGGVGGEFDNVTKTTKNNTVPTSSSDRSDCLENDKDDNKGKKCDKIKEEYDEEDEKEEEDEEE